MPLALVNASMRLLWTFSSIAPGPQQRRRSVPQRQMVGAVEGQFPGNLLFAFSPSDLQRILKRVPSLAQSVTSESSNDGAGSSSGVSWAARASTQAAILAREGLPPLEVAAIFASYPELLMARHLEENLAFFRRLLSGEQQQGTELQDTGSCRQPQRPGEPPSLTPLGRLLRAQPVTMGRALATQPSSHEALLRWYSMRLEASPQALAEAFPACPALFNVSAAGAEACVSHLTSGLGLSLATARRMVLAYPPALKLTAAAVDGKLEQLSHHLGLDHKGAVDFAARHPRALGTDLAARLPPLLEALQDLFAPEFDPAALLMDNPLLSERGIF